VVEGDSKSPTADPATVSQAGQRPASPEPPLKAKDEPAKDSQPVSLWDRAYDALAEKDDHEHIKKYEELLSRVLERGQWVFHLLHAAVTLSSPSPLRRLGVTLLNTSVPLSSSPSTLFSKNKNKI
jgi:hypothetical protein